MHVSATEKNHINNIHEVPKMEYVPPLFQYRKLNILVTFVCVQACVCLCIYKHIHMKGYILLYFINFKCTPNFPIFSTSKFAE